MVACKIVFNFEDKERTRGEKELLGAIEGSKWIKRWELLLQMLFSVLADTAIRLMREMESKGGIKPGTGGPSWEVPLGRRDSLDASVQGSNNNLPAPNSTLSSIITKFKLQGLDIVDVVALSGAHTIGDTRCVSFRQRLYNQSGNGVPDFSLNPAYAAGLRTKCPSSGGDQNLFFLDLVTPFKFDNQYFKNLLVYNGILNSDEVLFTQSAQTMELVKLYAENNELFFEQFAKSMVKMGNISPLTWPMGEIRKNCRRVNHH
ncbi:Peroxidase [Rhynchospora pubera]|uniref:Peroxidase n=1 Tax=Rhynchospora pubera TaxID=906938 RepID=A0AAV8DLV9_9POAL|nr:Peroxidase [Rhynchospora pubera]